MTEPHDATASAAAFARAVDAGDWDAVRRALADSCVRAGERDTLAGAVAIVTFYAERERGLVRDYDDIRREHAIMALAPGVARIAFTENVARAPSRWRRDRRVEDVTVDLAGRIVRIVERPVASAPGDGATPRPPSVADD